MTHDKFFEQLLRLDFNRCATWIAAVTYGRISRKDPDLPGLRIVLQQDGYLEGKAIEIKKYGLLRWATSLDPNNRARLVDAVEHYDPDIHHPKPEED